MTNERNVYQKLADVQMQLTTVEFKKTGHNKFGNFDYFELDDIMPAIQKCCYENDLLIEYSFNDDVAVLTLRDLNNIDMTISSQIPMPEIVAMNKKMNVVQSLGAYMTYIKRYLLLNMFLISEKSVIDSNEMTKISKACKPKAKKSHDKINHANQIQAIARNNKANDSQVFIME